MLTLRKDGKVGGLLHPDFTTDDELLATALEDFRQTLGRHGGSPGPSRDHTT
ncbi:hypothetical protein [Kitasatospora sp. NPDC001095]